MLWSEKFNDENYSFEKSWNNLFCLLCLSANVSVSKKCFVSFVFWSLHLNKKFHNINCKHYWFFIRMIKAYILTKIILLIIFSVTLSVIVWFPLLITYFHRFFFFIIYCYICSYSALILYIFAKKKMYFIVWINPCC